MLTIIPHIQQTEDWNCGLCCVAMILNGTGLAIGSSPQSISNFYPIQSIWTIDLAYLLRHYGLQADDVCFYTNHIGVNWNHSRSASSFYPRLDLQRDTKRIHSLFARASDQGVQISVGLLNEGEMKRIMGSNRCAIILLVNLNCLSCHLCEEKRRVDWWNGLFRKMNFWGGCLPCCGGGGNSTSTAGLAEGLPREGVVTAPSSSVQQNYMNGGGKTAPSTTNTLEIPQVQASTAAQNLSSSASENNFFGGAVAPLSSPPINISGTTSPVKGGYPSSSSIDRGGGPAPPIAKQHLKAFLNQQQQQYQQQQQPSSSTSLLNSSHHYTGNYSPTKAGGGGTGSVNRRLSFGGSGSQSLGYNAIIGAGSGASYGASPSSSIYSASHSSPLVGINAQSGGGAGGLHQLPSLLPPPLAPLVSFSSSSTLGGGHNNSGGGGGVNYASPFNASTPLLPKPPRTRNFSTSSVPPPTTFSQRGASSSSSSNDSKTCCPPFFGKKDKKAAASSAPTDFVGHYILLIGYDPSTDMYFWRDPGRSSAICAGSAPSVWKAYGGSKETDGDAIVVRIL